MKPILNGNVVEFNGYEFTKDNLEDLEELFSLWENVGFDGSFEELHLVIDKLYEVEDEELDIQDYLDEISFHTSQIENLIDCFGMGDYPKEMEKFILFFKNNYNLKMLRKQIKKLKPKMEGVGR